MVVQSSWSVAGDGVSGFMGELPSGKSGKSGMAGMCGAVVEGDGAARGGGKVKTAARRGRWAPNRALGAWAAEGRALQTDRSGLFFTAFLSNIQILDCKIGKNYPGWGQFSLCAPSAAQAPSPRHRPGPAPAETAAVVSLDIRDKARNFCPYSQ